MGAMLTWIVNIWDKFSLWVTGQPTFVDVAFGIGLFYVALQIAKAGFKLIAFLFSSLSAATPAHFKKQKSKRPRPRSSQKPPPDDESPPFVFR
jgi:hypothetical protein